MTQRIIDALAVFNQALKEGTIIKGSCTSCAVGNLVQEAIKQNPDEMLWVQPTDWGNAFTTSGGVQTIFIDDFNNIQDFKLKKVFAHMTFTPEELANIEFAFERNTNIEDENRIHYSDESIRVDALNGLKAVALVMLEFEGAEKEIDKAVTLLTV